MNHLSRSENLDRTCAMTTLTLHRVQPSGLIMELYSIIGQIRAGNAFDLHHNDGSGSATAPRYLNTKKLEVARRLDSVLRQFPMFGNILAFASSNSSRMHITLDMLYFLAEAIDINYMRTIFVEAWINRQQWVVGEPNQPLPDLSPSSFYLDKNAPGVFDADLLHDTSLHSDIMEFCEICVNTYHLPVLHSKVYIPRQRWLGDYEATMRKARYYEDKYKRERAEVANLERAADEVHRAKRLKEDKVAKFKALDAERRELLRQQLEPGGPSCGPRDPEVFSSMPVWQLEEHLRKCYNFPHDAHIGLKSHKISRCEVALNRYLARGGEFRDPIDGTQPMRQFLHDMDINRREVNAEEFTLGNRPNLSAGVRRVPNYNAADTEEIIEDNTLDF